MMEQWEIEDIKKENKRLKDYEERMKVIGKAEVDAAKKYLESFGIDISS